MATVQPQKLCTLEARSITSIQPGGGFFMRLELAWGRVRRAWLRLFCRGYVRRMAERRLGHCPNCPHDIIDARDLKYYRNVCGYSFATEDNPFHWRDDLGFTRAGLTEVFCLSMLFLGIIIFLLSAVNLIHRAFWGPLPIVALCWSFVLFFFRDPERAVPRDPDALLSPADGTVTHVGEVEEADFPGGRAFRVSIFLSIFNVHVNRIPRTSQVVGLRYFPGRFLDARHPECGVCNEQFWIDLEERHRARRLRVKQIAGAMARRIVCWLKPDETVWAGERFGMIKFGSRTEVLLPVSEIADVKVKVGDKVKGGSTVLLKLNSSPT